MASMEEEEEKKELVGSNTGKYPVMPSLVGLQQMKNRLHLARLGKKLMKWTALATGREMRRIALELMFAYERFKEDVGEAFMALARARYYCPTVNKMVIGNFPQKASVNIKTSSKSTAGVKQLILAMVEMQTVPYEYLGIGRGGYAITEAKQVWLELIRRMMLILQYRISFLDVECAHKNATKKKNVLEKVIVPRIMKTIEYILSELEEKEREEIFRLKRFKQMKLKHTLAKEKAKIKTRVPKVCVSDVKIEKPKQIPCSEPEPEVMVKTRPCGKPCITVCTKPIPETLKPIEVCCSCLSFYDANEDAPEPFCPTCKKAARTRGKESKLKLVLKSCESSEQQMGYKKQLGDLTSHIDEVINLTKQYKMDGIISPSIEKFIQTCYSTKEKIEDYANATTCDSHQKVAHPSKSVSATGSQKSVRSDVPDRPSEVPTLKAITNSDSTATIFPGELGYFESKYKEVIKITRLQNEDGTITEEKQVITVKTQRKTPRVPNESFEQGIRDERFEQGIPDESFEQRKPDECFEQRRPGESFEQRKPDESFEQRKPDESFEQDKFIGSCACPSYNIRKNIVKKNLDITESCDSGHRGDGGFIKTSRSNGPRETKSELISSCPTMVEPKLRACISAGLQNSMGDDIICKTCLSNISSKEIPLTTASNSTIKAQCLKSTAPSEHTICSLSKTHSVCSRKLTPHVSKDSLAAKKQTDRPQKKVTLDKSTYCTPYSCDGKINTVSSGAVWKNAFKSTLSDPNLRTTCTRKASTESTKKKGEKIEMKSDSCCRIKIIIKPHAVSDGNKMCKDEAISVTSSVINALSKRLPCNQIEAKRDWTDLKSEHLCLTCLVKLKDTPSSCTLCQMPPEDALEINGPCQGCLAKIKDSSHQTSGKCKICQEKLANMILMDELCKGCVDKFSGDKKPTEKYLRCKMCREKLDSRANNEVCAACLDKIGDIAPRNTPMGNITPKASNLKSVEAIEKEIGWLSSSSSELSLYYQSEATDTKSCDCTRPSSKYNIVPCKYSKKCLYRVHKKVSTRSGCSAACSEKQDASTVTKRCNRFDVRPIGSRRTCDISIVRPTLRRPKKCRSFHEKNYNYFKKSMQ